MPTGNPYKILGLATDANADEVRKAYRALVKKYHPDKNPDRAAAEKFIAIQAAYEQILKGEQTASPEDVGQQYRATQEQYDQELAAYKKRRAAARENIRQQKLREEAYKTAYLARLQNGNIGPWHKATAFLGALLFLAIWIDFFLPAQHLTIVVESYGIHSYGSMDGHLVQLLNSHDGRSYWVSDFYTQELPKKQQLKTIQTPWLKQVKALQFNDGAFRKSTPVHFSFYWAQIWVSLLLILPICSWYLASADIIFVAGSFVSRYAIGLFILYFLLTENRFLHLISFGQL